MPPQSYSLPPADFAARLGDTPEARRDYSLVRACDMNELWLARHAGGWRTLPDADGRPALMLWPHPDFARHFLSRAALDGAPEALDLDRLLDEVLPSLAEDDATVALFPIPGVPPTFIPAADLLDDLFDACAEGPADGAADLDGPGNDEDDAAWLADRYRSFIMRVAAYGILWGAHDEAGWIADPDADPSAPAPLLFWSTSPACASYLHAHAAHLRPVPLRVADLGAQVIPAALRDGRLLAPDWTRDGFGIAYPPLHIFADLLAAARSAARHGGPG